MGIYTPYSPDTWVPDQFQGFDGFPPSLGVDSGGATVLIPGVPARIANPNPPIIAASNSGAGGTPLYNVNPMDLGIALFGRGAQTMPMVDPNAMQVNGGGDGGSESQGGEIGPAVLPSLQAMPSATSAQMPTIIGTANVLSGGNSGNPGVTPPAITPQYLNQRLPSIVNPAPMNLGIPGCADGISGLVADHPVLAIAALAALAYMVWGKN